MSEDTFIPRTQQPAPQQGVVIVQPAACTPADEETRAAFELGQASADPGFLGIIAKQVQWQHQMPKAITTEEDLSAAVVLFDDMKRTLKALDDIRLARVAFPTKVINMINGMFRQVRTNIETSKGAVGTLIARKQAEKKAIYERQMAEQQAAANAAAAAQAEGNAPPAPLAPTSAPVSEGIGKVQFDAPPPELPPNTIESGTGAKVRTRTDIEITIESLPEFLKVLTSKEARQQWLASEVESLVTINMPALKKLLLANPKKRTIKGLVIEKVEKVM